MLAQNDDRNELIAMLAWQLDMGIDEALLDHPQVDAAPLRLDQLLAVAEPAGDRGVSRTVKSGAAPQPPASVKMAIPALANSAATASLDKVIADGAGLAGITSLTELQSARAKLGDSPLKHTASDLCFADGSTDTRRRIIDGETGREEDRMGEADVRRDGETLGEVRG